MKRVVVFQGLGGLGVAEPNVPLPDGVWQRGQPTPARDAAIWYRTDNIEQRSKFPVVYPTPPANCRMCPPGDSSPDCCVSSTKMPQYTDWGMMAYRDAYKPWNHDSTFFTTVPPTTEERVQYAMDQSLRQAKLEMAAPMDVPPNPQARLAGMLSGLGSGGQGQNHLLGLGAAGQGQNHLLGLSGCRSCGLAGGTFTEDDGSLNTTGKVAIGAGVVAVAGIIYMMTRKKGRR